MRIVPALITLHPTVIGGRKGPAGLDGQYRPHLQVGQGELLGVEFAGLGQHEVRPGESASVVLRLLYDTVDYSALTPGARFSIMEGQRVVGIGEVLPP